MKLEGWSQEIIETDLLIIGGGAAGIYAAYRAKETSPATRVLIMEKAHILRSGCLAAGINAINAYLNPGETPESFLDYVKKDSYDLVREDLVYSFAEGVNKATERLEEWGLPIQKDSEGHYLARGKRSVRINGENIKPIMARALSNKDVQVLNRVNASNYLIVNGRVRGAFGFSIREKKIYLVLAKATICATGGAAGIYKSNNPGAARHKMWYSPFNTGAGLAMGLRAGAEMTSFEMRFIALRTKDTLSPTGTIAQGVKAPQVNAKGETYRKNYPSDNTAMRLFATLQENLEGRGPCYLDTTHLDTSANETLKEAFLNMSPSILLKWADEAVEPMNKAIEICGSEPYIVGGHGIAGYWVDVDRRSTLKGLFAAGEVVGGAPKKYVTGSMVEGERAALAALEDIEKLPAETISKELLDNALHGEVKRVLRPLEQEGGFTPEELEERLQKLMDEYAGGIGTHYRVCEGKLLIAKQKLRALEEDLAKLMAVDDYAVLQSHEVIDRVLVAQVVVEHLLYRKETRWPCYQERTDYPDRDDTNWLKFVNSRYNDEDKKVHIIERPFRKLGEEYDS